MTLQCCHGISSSCGATGGIPALFLAAWCMAVTNVLMMTSSLTGKRLCSAQESQPASGWHSCLGCGQLITQNFIPPSQTVIQLHWPLSVSVVGAFLLQVNYLIAIGVRSRAGSAAQWLLQSAGVCLWEVSSGLPSSRFMWSDCSIRMDGESPASQHPRKEVPVLGLEGPAAWGLQAGYAGSQMTSQTRQLLATLGRRRAL